MLNDQEIEEMMVSYANGESIEAIAERLNIIRTDVYYYLLYYKEKTGFDIVPLPRLNKASRRIRENIEEIYEQKNKGMIWQELAEHWGVSIKILQNEIDAYEWRKRRENGGNLKLLEKLDDRGIIDAFWRKRRYGDMVEKDPNNVRSIALAAEIIKEYCAIKGYMKKGMIVRKEDDIPQHILRLDEIVERYQNGEKQEELAKEFKISKRYLQFLSNIWRTRRGVTEPRKKVVENGGKGSKRKPMSIGDFLSAFHNTGRQLSVMARTSYKDDKGVTPILEELFNNEEIIKKSIAKGDTAKKIKDAAELVGIELSPKIKVILQLSINDQAQVILADEKLVER